MTKTYYPELGDKKPNGELTAEYGYGGKWNVKTELNLKGQGIKRREEENVIIRYLVTEKALEKLRKEYTIIEPIYLD